MEPDRKAKIIIKLTPQQLLLTVLLSVFLFAPDDLFKATSMYISTTPQDIAYKWLNYSFSYLYIIPICIGALISLKQNRYTAFLFPTLLLVRSLFKYICRYESIIKGGNYEIVLTIIVGTCLFIWVQYMINIEEVMSQHNFFIWFVVIHVASQITSFIYSLAGFTNRYNAINLDVECTGLLCGFAFLYVFFSYQISKRGLLLFLFGIGELLSGARIPTIIMLAMLFAYIIISPKYYNTQLYIGNIVCPILMILTFAVALTIRPELIDRMVEKGLFSSASRIINFISNEDTSSSIGRTKSILVGIDVLKENPFGLDCGFIFLQRRMNEHGYPTFPHSLMLTYYLLLGPGCLLIILYLWGRKIHLSIKKLRNETSEGLSSSFLIGYLVFMTILTGGPIVNYKVIFIYLLLVSVASMNNTNEQSSVLLDNWLN